MVSLTNRKNLIGHAHYLQKHFPQVMFCKPAEPAHTSSQGSTGMDPVMKANFKIKHPTLAIDCSRQHEAALRPHFMWAQRYLQRINLYPQISCQVRRDCQLIYGHPDCSKRACGTWQLTHNDSVVYFNFLASTLKSILLKDQDCQDYFTYGLSNTNACNMCISILE